MKKIGWSLLLCTLLLGSTGVSAVRAGTYSGDWVNSDSFSSGCLGYTDNYPGMLYSQAASILSVSGFGTGQRVIGHGFTRSAFLAALAPEFAVYVHSHGDVYNYYGSAFWQDPSSGCGGSSDYVTAAQVKPRAYPPYGLVIMSTCYLGSVVEPHSGNPNLMPDAFGIPKTQVTSGNQFYMGYVYETYDSASYNFENYFLAWLNAFPGSTFFAAWHYAASFTYSYPDNNDPFLAAWYGDINAHRP